MPIITADDGCPLNVEIEGRDGGPVLMLSNSLGTNLNMWDDQAAARKVTTELARLREDVELVERLTATLDFSITLRRTRPAEPGRPVPGAGPAARRLPGHRGSPRAGERVAGPRGARTALVRRDARHAHRGRGEDPRFEAAETRLVGMTGEVTRRRSP